MTEASTTSRYRVAGMDCAACAAKIDRALRRLPGIEDVSVSVMSEQLSVRHRDEAGVAAAIEQQVGALGYGIAPAGRPAAAEPEPHGHDHHHHDHAAHRGAHGHAHDHASAGHAHHHHHAPSDGPWRAGRRLWLTLASGGAFVAAYLAALALPQARGIAFAAAVLVGLLPIAWRALVAARAGTPFSIETLMTVAAIGAVAIDAAEEAAAVVVLFLVGELLEGAAAGRARASIRGLAALMPKTALVERGGSLDEAAAAAVAVDEVVLVRPGDRVPVDGVVLSGASSVDEAPVTGESVPRPKGEGDRVFAGTINGEAALRVRTTATAADNTIARVIRLVEEAESSKAPTERFIDRFSGFYTPAVLVLGALVALLPPLLAGAAWSAWIYKGLAILLIGCPCALVISTPAAIAASLAAGARRGLLMKGGAVLESIGRVTVVAFDKTGTLTEGRPRVSEVIAFRGDDREVLRLAAALETSASHPLALAILDHARAQRLDIPAAHQVVAYGGEGIGGRLDGAGLFLGSPKAAARRGAVSPDELARLTDLARAGKSITVLLRDGVALGAIALEDAARADAKPALAQLAALGTRAVMLTGDGTEAAIRVGRDLGIEVRAGLMPEDKQRVVRELQAKGARVAKVGDGINDAPALAAADVGIAMGSATDVALEAADAAILNGRLGDVAAMIALSRRTMANIRQNIAIALGLKAVFLVTTLAGVTGLWPAILADTGATVLVTANALRLLRPPC